jgi:hypothetical protein
MDEFFFCGLTSDDDVLRPRDEDDSLFHGWMTQGRKTGLMRSMLDGGEVVCVFSFSDGREVMTMLGMRNDEFVCV